MMKHNFLYILIPLLIAACTAGENHENDAVVERSEYDFFVSFMDGYLTSWFSKDNYDYYQSVKNDSFLIQQRLPNSELHIETEQFYVGELYLGDMPMTCRLYELNLQGSEKEKEFVGVLESSPILSGSIDLLIFNSDRKLIGEHAFSAFRNENSSFSFVDLNGDKNYEIIVDADIHRSVYDNKAKHIVNIENDSTSLVFSGVTYFYDNQRFDQEHDYLDSSEVQFIENESENYPQIEVETKRYKIRKSDERTELIETKKETHLWSQDSLQYVKNRINKK